jgi:tRNA-specific 2-thiouridylase
MAADFDLEARKSRESQDLCFVTEGTHGDWVDLRSFDTKGAGDIVDMDANIVGRHRGIHYYTIGQRKGLGIAMGYPVYVVEIDAAENRIVIGSREFSMGNEVTANSMIWNKAEGIKIGDRFECQVRYNHSAALCTIKTMNGDNISAVFDEPQFAITPGQLAVFYENDCVIGSGWIEHN